MKTALIIGSEGQDGQLLFEYLMKKSYSIIGIDINTIKIYNHDWARKTDILSKQDVELLIKTIKPDEVYFLAAYHHSSEDIQDDDYQIFLESYKVHVLALNNFLNTILTFSPKTRLFYASSSFIFGQSESRIDQVDENTPFNPITIYGITKLDGMHLCRYYRNKYGIFASVGILFNHESHLRKDHFLSKKIIKGAINIKTNKQDKLIIGDINACIDWGYAPDFVDAMHKILNIDKSDDFIIATGVKHTVRDFVETTFNYLNLDYKKYIEIDEQLLTRKNPTLIGNPAKLNRLTGWKPSTSFEEMIRIMLIKEGAKLGN